MYTRRIRPDMESSTTPKLPVRRRRFPSWSALRHLVQHVSGKSAPTALTMSPQR